MRRLPPPEADDLARVFAALGHAARVRLLAVLAESPGLRLPDLATAAGTSRARAARHLRVLADAGLVEAHPGDPARFHVRSAAVDRAWTVLASRVEQAPTA